MKKIAIWGDYGHGNYGDDVMAIMYAQKLKFHGFLPVVYKLNGGLAKKYDIRATSDIEDLIRDASFCMIGGGGILVGENYLRILLRSHAREFELGFYQLEKTLKKYKCPCYAFSIGGNGNGKDTHLPWFRNHFWKNGNCKFATVRLMQDVELLQSLGVEVEYIPDVLLSIPEEFKVEKKIRKPSEPIKVGVNLIAKDCGNLLQALVNEAKARKDITFYFIKSHLSNYGTSYEAIPNNEKLENIQIYEYTDPEHMINFLESMDILISSKLHLGVTALSLGTPFFSYQGKRKTKSFLESIDAEFALQLGDKPDNILQIINTKQSIGAFRDNFNIQLLNQGKEMSKLHFTRLLDIAQHTDKNENPASP